MSKNGVKFNPSYTPKKRERKKFKAVNVTKMANPPEFKVTFGCAGCLIDIILILLVIELIKFVIGGLSGA